MATVAQALAAAERRLAGFSESPRFDAELLLAHALGLTRAGLFAQLGARCDAPDFETYVGRRARGEPIAYILSAWEFFSLEIEVQPPVLVPRPETEHLVEAVLEHIGARAARVLDLCTGTGCVAAAIAANAPHARVVAADSNPDYAALAQRNSERHGLAERLRVLTGDLFGALPEGEARFDVVCANPPYVAENEWPALSQTIRSYEDPAALLAGVDGLDCFRRIVEGAPRWLAPGGLLALEIGMGQGEAVRELFEAAGFAGFRICLDLAGIPRIACGYERKGRGGAS